MNNTFTTALRAAADGSQGWDDLHIGCRHDIIRTRKRRRFSNPHPQRRLSICELTQVPTTQQVHPNRNIFGKLQRARMFNTQSGALQIKSGMGDPAETPVCN